MFILRVYYFTCNKQFKFKLTIFLTVIKDIMIYNEMKWIVLYTRK